MDPETGTSVVTRGRLLALAVLAAFAWLMLTLFGVSTPANADEGSGTVDTLLETLTAEVDDIAPLTLVEPLSSTVDQAIADRATEPLEPVVARVVEPVVAHAVEPVLGQPLVTETVRLVEDILTESAASPELSVILNNEPFISAPATPGVVVAAQQGPVAVALTSAASDTKAAHVPAAGSHPPPSQPHNPTGPAVAVAPSLTQHGGGPTLLAAMPASLGLSVQIGSPAGVENFTPPGAPTFDSDASPD